MICSNPDACTEHIRGQDAEIGRLKALLVRAANALRPYALGFPDGNEIRKLIAELRKAAE